MLTEKPIFASEGALLNCEACPWHENGCPNFRCPTRENYKSACEQAMREVAA
jgi:hypothetical protein